MANLSEIQERMNSIKDTMKITNAMYMISTNKLRKAKQALENTEPYFNRLDNIIASVLTHAPHISHDVFGNTAHIEPKNRKRAFLVITADKGLAGAYNHNVLKRAELELSQPMKESQLYMIGMTGEQYFKARGYRIDETFHYTAQNPSLSRARKISQYLMNKFKRNEFDELFIVYTRMMSSVEMEPAVTRILPLSREDYENETGDYAAVPMFPSPEAVLSSVAPLCVSGYIYSTMVEAYCCEQNSRVNAMQAATDAGTDMLRELSIKYNRARQAKITQEITEVIGGARALKRK